MKLNFNALKKTQAKISWLTNGINIVTKNVRKNNVSKKVFALTLIIVLLMPMFFFGDWAKSAAASLDNLISSFPQTPASNAAPPAPFVFSSSDTFSAKFASTILTVNTSVANGFVSAADFFTTPQLPEGFKAAKPVSPATALLFSIGDSLESFFGFFSTTTSNALTAPPPVPSGSTSFDYDGDGKADVARFRSSTGTWEIKYSNNTTASGMLAPGKLAPADFDGDGKTDLASFSNGTWTIRYSSTGQVAPPITGFGQAGDVPVSGNYIGNGAADLAVWRPSNGTWYIREVGNTTITSYQFGQAGDIPVPGNYDGQGYLDYAVFRPLGGVWHIQGSSSGYYYAQWGLQTDIPTAADFDGDGKTDMAVYRPSSGAWYSLNSGSGGGYIADTWGNYGDQPAPADYDNDGKADFAIYRPTSGVWHTKKSNGGAYEFTALGTLQDMAVSSAYIKQVGGQIATYDMAKTRLSPKNATGGTDLYSRNFGWSSSLVGLPGRAGLDMGFGISYNSLIWTKHTDPATNASTMYFDVDNSNISPGFRFGFPVIEPIYYSDDSKDFSYMMISPSGARTEFKQKKGASDTFETVNSSYIQLKTTGSTSPNDPVENITITVTGTDGTRMSYNWKGGAFRASEIKDRNGNFITIAHDEYGLLQSVTDTLGRVVSVDYDSQLYPTAIKQTWKDDNGTGPDVMHYWARFEYTTINVNPSFASTLGIYGPTGGTPVKVLNKIKRADDGYTVFEYQPNGFGQVSKIRSFAKDNHELNYVQTNLASPGSNLTDCPRLSQTKTWAENFNGGAEVVFNNDYQENQPLWGGGQGTIITTTSPNGVIVEKSHMFGSGSGWVEALPFYSETCTSTNCTGTDKKRWTVTTWTQDDTNLSYKKNPRVTSSTVSDYVSSRKTEFIYSDPNQPLIARYGLKKEVHIYDLYQNNALLKSAIFSYKLTEPYLSRNIIGLPSEQKLFDENNALMSKVNYEYDEGNFGDSALEQNISPIQHDNSNYGSSFVSGRGNLTSTSRHDVTGITSAVTSHVKYNTAGSSVATIDPVGRQTKISYEDKFKNGSSADLNYNTYAYPTKLTDPLNKYSQIKYRYDVGVNIWAKSPGSQDQSQGKISTRKYDSAGRLEKETLNNTGAYTRYEYFPNGTRVKTFSTVTDVNNNGADSADEIVSENLFDGSGNIIRSRNSHPGSLGGWSGSFIEYDVLGRVKRSTVPTEINDDWELAGEGLNTGWLWKSQEYDWKSRITRQINTDNSDILINYDGCGCAGGQLTTIQSELVPRDDQPNTFARRIQRTYSDTLGRNYKTENLKWDGSVYSSTVSTFNGRDQVTQIKEFKGASTSSQFQTTSFTYDGHGRLKTKHLPQQDTDKNTIYTYYADDKIQSVTDARQATSVYTYEQRGLVASITYTLPSDGIGASSSITPASSPAPPPNPSLTSTVTQVLFEYDNLGNRTKMDDQLGEIVYQYNDLSQMLSETRKFDDNLPSAPIVNGQQAFKTTYTYQLGGQLKSLTDPYNQQVTYNYNADGRLNEVSGTPYGGESIYASATKYTAWGKLKELTYGNGDQMLMTFNNRLQVNHYELNKTGQNPEILKKNYEYYGDGKLRYSQDQRNPIYDRLQIFDHQGRIKEAKSGLEARGGTVAPIYQSTELPYRQSFQNNEYNNLTQRNNLHWGITEWDNTVNNLNYTYHNDRIVNEGWQHDADGRLILSFEGEDYIRSYFDATGLLTYQSTSYENAVFRFYDGNGREVKRGGIDYRAMPPVNPDHYEWVDRKPIYYIRSSVLENEVINEVDYLGKRSKAFIKAAGVTIATQTGDVNNSQNQYVLFEHSDASGMSHRTTKPDGNAVTTEGFDGAPAEFDPLGGNMGLSTPYVEPLPTTGPDFPTMQPLSQESPERINGFRVNCNLDGFSTSCSTGFSLLASGGATIQSATSDIFQLGFGTIIVIPGSNEAPSTNEPIPGLEPGEIEGSRAGGTPDRYFLFGATWNIQDSSDLTDRQRTAFNDARDHARNKLRNSKNCRDAIVNILDRVADSLLKNQVVTTPDGENFVFNNLTDFVYNSNTESSRYLDVYNSSDVTMSASGRSGRDGNNITYGTAVHKVIAGTTAITWNREFFSISTEARSLHVLHEILHHYGTDIEIANAIAAISNDRPNGGNNPTRTFTADDSPSQYINNYLSRRDVCDLPVN